MQALVLTVQGYEIICYYYHTTIIVEYNYSIRALVANRLIALDKCSAWCLSHWHRGDSLMYSW